VGDHSQVNASRVAPPIRRPAAATERRAEPAPAPLRPGDDLTSATPSQLLVLQRSAGNGVVSALLAARAPLPPREPPVVQRADKPANLDEALHTGDSDELEPFRPFTGITQNQLLSLVNMIVTEGFVSWREESILEEAWRSRGSDALAESDYALWKSCANRGADVKNVFWLRDMRSQFATDVREKARDNLTKNQQTIEKEASRLGVTLGSGPQLPASPEADAALREQEQQARDLKDAKDALGNLRRIAVGYDPDPALGGTSRPGGAPDEATQDRVRAQFDPEKPPQFPPKPEDGMPAWSTIAAVHKDLTLKVADTLDRNPALYALMAADTNNPTLPGGSDALATPGQSPDDARAKLNQAFGEVLDDIRKSQDAINDSSLGFEAMHPIHQTFFATHPTYSKPFAKAAAQDYVQEEGGAADTAGLAVTVAVMVLILGIEIATAGTATPAIGALLGLTASGAIAADSWNQWAKLDNAARATVSTDGSIVFPEQADQALLSALINTAMALFDVYGAGKAVKGAASLGRVAALEAELALRKRLATASAKELADFIEQEGAEAAVKVSGRSADDLIRTVGRETPAGQRLAALTGVGKASVEDMTRSLAQLAEKSATEARELINQSIDALGPSETLKRAGGLEAVERAVAQDAGVLGRLDAWRQGLIDEAEKAFADASGKEGADSVRTFLAERGGVGADVLESALGIAVMFLGDGQGDADHSLDGVHQPKTLDLDLAAEDTARRQGIPVQRAIVTGAPAPLTERELDLLSPDEFEELVRTLISSGHFSAEGLPRMSVLELKNTSGHGLDGIGLRRRAGLVDVYKFEFKQVTTGSIHVPELGQTLAGTQGGLNWANVTFDRLASSSDPVAMETLDALNARLRRIFGGRYSESLLMDAFQHELGRAPLAVVTRVHASLDRLIPQLRGIARTLGKGNVMLLLIRGRK
jgi:hypothetical protein